MTSYTKKAFYGFLWVFCAALMTNVIGYLLRVLLTRELSVTEYGMLYSVMALFGLVAIFQTWGLQESIGKHVSAAKANGDDAKVNEIVLWSLIVLFSSTLLLFLAVMLFAPFIGGWYLHDSFSSTLMRIYAIHLLLSPATIIALGLFQGLQKMREYAFVMLGFWGMVFGFTAIALYLGYGVAGAMSAYALSTFTIMVLCTMYFMFFVKIRRARLHLSTLKELLSYGLPAMMTVAISAIILYTDTILLTLFSSVYEVGIYQAALPTANILLFAVSVIPPVVLPLVSEMWTKKQHHLVELAVEELYLYAVILLLPFVMVVLMFPDLILNLLFGSEYIPGAMILRLLAVSALFLTANAINTSVLSGIGRPKDNTKIMVFGALCNLCINLALIPYLGGIGAGIATLSTSILMFVISTIVLSKHVKVHPPIWNWSKAVIAGILMVVAIYAFRAVPMESQILKAAIAASLGFVCYGLLLFAFNVLSVERIVAFKSRLLKR